MPSCLVFQRLYYINSYQKTHHLCYERRTQKRKDENDSKLHNNERELFSLTLLSFNLIAFLFFFFVYSTFTIH